MNVESLGAHTFGFIWSHAPEDAFAQIASLGCKHVQLMATPPHFDPWREDAGRTKALRAQLAQSRLDLVAIDLASNDVNLASPSADVRAFSVAAYRSAIARAAELGAPALCIGSGRRHALFPAADGLLMDGFRRAFADIHRAADNAGLRLLLENHPQGLLARADRIADWLNAEGYDDIGVIYDVANALAAGEEAAEGISALGARLSIVHLSDTPRGAWLHGPIGCGDIDFGVAGAALRACGFDGPIILEIIADNPARAIADGLERLAAAGWVFPSARTH